MEHRKVSPNIIYSSENAVIYGGNKDIGVYGQICVLNNMKAKGISPVSLHASIFFGEDKSKVYPMKNRMLKSNLDYPADKTKICIEKLPECTKPWVSVYGVGIIDPKVSQRTSTVKAGMDIVQTGFVGAEGTVRIVQEKKGELLKRFTPAFLNPIKNWESELSIKKIVLAGMEEHAVLMRHVGEQGITQALWNLAEETSLGISVDIKKLLVRQETIEICERYRINPYRLSSIGCTLMVSENGGELADKLKAKGYAASVVGVFSDGNDKIFRNGEEQSYMECQPGNEMIKLWNKNSTEF